MQKTLVLTGGSSGIGLAIAAKFEANDYRVINLDIQSGKHGEYIHCDVTDHAQVSSTIASIAKDNPINVLICNAGKHVSANIEETSEAELLALFRHTSRFTFYEAQWRSDTLYRI
jgi:2-keto-3-deoxy-L-fuconate dehydrogenase